MTTFGVSVIDPDSVIGWADSELYEEGNPDPTAFAPKLSANSLISAVAAGAGRISVTRQADEVFLRCAEFDLLPDLIATALRKAAFAHGSYFTRNPDEFARQHYAIAGWSHSAGRMLGYSFSARDFFAPQLTGQFMSPETNVLPCWRPRNGDEVVQTAQVQMHELRAGRCRGAGVGALTIAHVRPGTITLQTIQNFDTAARGSAGMGA